MKKYSILFICLTAVFLSCTENKKQVSEVKPVKKAIGKLVTDSIAPPVITPLSPPRRMEVTITSKPFSLDPRMGKEDITTLTTANGLPAGSYQKVVQDRAGNFWFNATTKIVKYDGHQFTSFYTIPGGNDYIQDIAIGSNNDLWVVVSKMNSSGTGNVDSLYVFDGFSFHPVPDMQNVSNQVNGISMYPQVDETIWVTDGKKILKFNGNQLQQTISQNDFSFKWINDIKTDRQGNTWFLDRIDSTLTRYDGKTFEKLTHRDGLPETALRSVIPFAADSMYLSTVNGIWFFNGRQSTKLNDNISSTLMLDKNGSLWFNGSFLGGESLSKISASGITTIEKEDGLDVGTTGWRLGLDNDDNVWVLMSNAIKRLYKPVTAYGELFPATGFTQVRPSYFDKRGNFWVGSFQHGLSCFNGKTVTNYSFPGKNASNFVHVDNNIMAVTEDKAGNIWFRTAAPSLIKFDGRSFFQYNKLNGWNDTTGGLLLEVDKKGNIWTNSITEGVAYLNGKEKVTFTTKQGLCSNSVYCFFEDRTGAKWFGTQNGLSRLQNGQFTTYNTVDGLPNKSINAITDDEYGNLWLYTDGGVSRFDGEKFINYTTEDGSVAGAGRIMKKDSVNNLLWLTSDAGFTTVTIKANHPDSVVFEHFSEGDGYPLNGNSVLIDHNGALWTSELKNSLTRFDYKKVKENSRPFNLHINQIRLNNEAICWSNLTEVSKDSPVLQMEMQLRFGKNLSHDRLEQMATLFSGVRYDSIIPFDFIPYNLSLPYKANSISFDFAAIDPHFSKSTRYQYMLEGLDETWSPLSKSTNANFSNLREGSYTFKVKALNLYGKWSELNYSFKVLPPWYRTWWAYTLYALLFILSIYSFIRWRTNALQKEKVILEEKVAARTTELKESLENLKATQSQLIQSEKMASLGELTAGIAHEIQNPLNFVNNFSEVSKELIEEMEEERAKNQEARDETLVSEIIGDIKQNLEKINHHGRRADAIVKGMLEHSRTSSGEKVPTDLNALADEYLRLSYHGLRAKDKNFNVDYKTDFDPDLPKVNVVPQDIGRVFLNIINNAFQALNNGELSPDNYLDKNEEFKPLVTVSTKNLGDKIEISVKDNGPGIPSSIKDKIFQPFFTTKPTGQGTGLGLSLSYDIVKAHGGEIKLESKTGEGSSFIISLPTNQ